MIYLDYNGEQKSIKEISDITGKSKSFIYYLLYRCKTEKEVFERLNKRKKYIGKIEYKGKKYTIDELMEFSVVSRAVFVNRYYNFKWEVEKALKTPVYKGGISVKEYSEKFGKLQK